MVKSKKKASKLTSKEVKILGDVFAKQPYTERLIIAIHAVAGGLHDIAGAIYEVAGRWPLDQTTQELVLGAAEDCSTCAGCSTDTPVAKD